MPRPWACCATNRRWTEVAERRAAGGSIGVALRTQQSRESRRGEAVATTAREPARGSGRRAGADAGERERWPAGGGRFKMTSGSEGKIVFYIFAQLETIIILGVVCWK